MIFINFSIVYTISKEVNYMEYPYEETGERILNMRIRMVFISGIKMRY